MSDFKTSDELLWWAAKGSEPLCKAALEQGASWLADPRVYLSELGKYALPMKWATRSALAVALSTRAGFLAQKELENQGPDSTSGGVSSESLLVVACKAANADWVRRWSVLSESLDAKNTEGRTALALAVTNRGENALRCAGALIAAGADLEACDNI